jgi:hypothetical protein
MNSLIEPFFLDRTYRRAIYALSGIVSALYASLSLLDLGRGKLEVTAEAGGLYCLLIVGGILLRSSIRKAQTKEPRIILEPVQSRSVSISLALGLALFGISQSNIIVRVQTALIDARIANFDRSSVSAYLLQTPDRAETQLRYRFQRLEAITDVSYRYQIPITPGSLSKAEEKVRTALRQPRLSEKTRQAGLVAYSKLNELGAIQATADNINPVKATGYVINSILDLSDEKIRFIGNHSALIFGDGEIVVQNSTAVFDGIDFRAQQSFREAFYVVGSGSSVVVHNATVENLAQTLDRITWINVEFRHSMIKVQNGPFTLVNVTFADCDLRWLPRGGRAGEELLDMINKASGKPVTFAYEGIPLPTTSKPE